MKMSAAFPSEYLRAADLNDRPALFVMERVEMRDIGDDHKPVLFFQMTDKGFVMNKTNTNTIIGIYGDDSEGWIGKEIVLYPTMTDYQGKQVPAIRVRAAKKRPAVAPVGSQVRPAPEPPQARQEDFGARIEDDSEVPF